MALTKIRTGGITADAVDNTILKLDDDFALTGTVTGAGVSTATSTLPSEGGAATTIVAQGLAKVWVHMNGQGTPAAEDSFNLASVTDTGTGRYTLVVANDFSSANYTCAAMAGNNGTTTEARGINIDNTPATTGLAVRCLGASSGVTDDPNLMFNFHGDLA